MKEQLTEEQKKFLKKKKNEIFWNIINICLPLQKLKNNNV